MTTLGKNEAAAGATYMWKEGLDFDVACKDSAVEMRQLQQRECFGFWSFARSF